MATRPGQRFVSRTEDASRPIRVLIFGAHPDDPDFMAGGVAALYGQRGHHVKMVAVTNGDAGHHEMGGVPLALRRRAEAAAAGMVLGAEYVTLDNHDCVLMPTVEVRFQLIRVIREFQPDLIITHRPWDYHPDHRYTSQLVQDAVYATTVPNVVSDADHLDYAPTVVYAWDNFQKPYPFVADVVVGIDDVVERKVDAIGCHVSQVYEFLPYNRRYQDQVPQGPDERRAWLRGFLEPRLNRIAGLYRERLLELYGEEMGGQIKYAEAFERCEYGAPLPEDGLGRLFPFF